jgi:hypothetical protein
MIANKGLFTKGLVALIAFFAVLFGLFMPLFEEGNTLNYMDNLYNSISKGSAYYIPKMRAENAAFSGKSISLELTMATDRQAEETLKLLEKGGARVGRNGTILAVNGDLGSIMSNCLADADLMFHNKGEDVRNKYGYSEKQALYNWWTTINKMDMGLKKQKMFNEAKFVGNVNQRAVECAYNYYNIEPQKINDKIGIVVFSLVFYVLYTLWFGFSIMWMFEGWGMRLEH